MSSESKFSDEDNQLESASPSALKSAERQLEVLEDRSKANDKKDVDNLSVTGSFVWEEEDHATFWNNQPNKNKQKKSTVGKTTKGVPRKVLEKTDVTKIVREVEERCCKKGCIRDVPVRLVKEKRENYWRKTVGDRKLFLNNAVESASQGMPVLDGTFVCVKAWCTVYGVTLASYFERLRLHRNGEKGEQQPTARKKSLAFDLAVEWFRHFSRNADHLPNSSSRPLPACLSKKAVYLIYKEEMGERPILSRTHFVYKMWKLHFPEVYIPKQSRFTKCTICVHLREELRSPGKGEDERRQLQLMRKLHLTQQMTERNKYYKHNLKATNNPGKYLSVIVDGMDQAKHNLPHFNANTKIDGSAWRLKTHVTGVLAFHQQTSAYAFIDLCEWSHDSNLTISVLLETLLDIKKSLGYLPSTLYLQMDNCWRENKNKFILGFLCVLVELSVFEKIKLSFLLVGHTHENIDQMFSCFARRLAKHEAHTLDELIKELSAAYTPNVNAKQLESVFDAKGWMEGELNGLSGHIHQHCFKITKNESGKAVIFYKKWTSSDKWMPEGGIRLISGIPKGSAQVVKPQIESINLEKIQQDLPKYRLKFHDDTMSWWSSFLQKQRRRESRNTSNLKWDLGSLRPNKPGESVSTSVASSSREELERLFTKEQREVEVSVQRKRKASVDLKTSNEKRSKKTKA